MRNAIFAALLGAGTVLVALGGEGPSVSAYGPAAGQDLVTGDGLVSVLTTADEQGQQLMLIDPRTRTLGVYHIARGSVR